MHGEDQGTAADAQTSLHPDDPLFTSGLLTPKSIEVVTRVGIIIIVPVPPLHVLRNRLISRNAIDMPSNSLQLPRADPPNLCLRQLNSILEAFNAVPSSLALVDKMRVRSSVGQRVETTKRMVRRLVGSEQSAQEFLDAGKCIVFLLERLADCIDESAPAAAPLRKLRHVMDAHLGGEATVHLWLSGREGSKALQLHADEYDFVLVQLNGTKQWEVCVPAPVVPLATTGDDGGSSNGDDWNDARTAALHDLFIFGRNYNEAIREAELLMQDHEKPGSQQGFNVAAGGKPTVLRVEEGSSSPYADINVTDPQIKCTNLTVNAGNTPPTQTQTKRKQIQQTLSAGTKN